MKDQQKEEFANQLRNSILKAVETIKTESKYEKIKSCYYKNFEEISILIKKNGTQISIEDIYQLCNLNYNKMDSFLMKNINLGIKENIISKVDFK